MGRDWLYQVKKKCPEVKFLEHYALLGKYDFLDIYEAPDEESAAKVSMISLSNGAFQSESLVAIPYKRFVELTAQIWIGIKSTLFFEFFNLNHGGYYAGKKITRVPRYQ